MNLRIQHPAAVNKQRLLGSRKMGGRVGDVSVIQPVAYPVLTPMIRPQAGPMRRRFGESSIDRIRYGSANFWAGSGVDVTSNDYVSVGGPEIVQDVSDFLREFSNIGFQWDVPNERLEVFLTKNGQGYRVQIPVAKVAKIFWRRFNREHGREGCNCAPMVGNPALKDLLSRTTAMGVLSSKFGGVMPGDTKGLQEYTAALNKAKKAKKTSFVFRGKTIKLKPPRDCKGFFKWMGCAVEDVGKEIGKAATNVVKGVKSFVKDPGKWVQNAVKDVGRFAEKAGKVVVDVVNSPVFKGVMGAIAVIPPFQAVGALGLAASTAVKIAKPAIEAVDAAVKTGKKVAEVVRTAEGVAKRVNPSKAASVVSNFKAAANKMPPKAQNLLKAAMLSTPYQKPKGMPVFKAMGTAKGVLATVQMRPGFPPKKPGPLARLPVKPKGALANLPVNPLSFKAFAAKKKSSINPLALSLKAAAGKFA